MFAAIGEVQGKVLGREWFSAVEVRTIRRTGMIRHQVEPREKISNKI
jgi:hypothetical protein